MKVNIEYDETEFQEQIKADVEIVPRDVWSADVTLAHIIHPVLLQIKEDKKGAPCVDNEDVPDEIRAPEVETFEGIDVHWHNRWKYVLNEMIWAFEYAMTDSNDYVIGYKQDRAQNGFRLFGKYYKDLWT